MEEGIQVDSSYGREASGESVTRTVPPGDPGPRNLDTGPRVTMTGTGKTKHNLIGRPLAPARPDFFFSVVLPDPAIAVCLKALPIPMRRAPPSKIKSW